jgi:hypothetical protein
MQGKWFRILFRARDADRVLALPLASSYMATMPKREPTSAEYQALLNENDALRLENAFSSARLSTTSSLRSRPKRSAWATYPGQISARQCPVLLPQSSLSGRL